MAQCLIIADDLTGANATGVLLHKTGYSADTILNLIGISKSQLDSYDCLLYPTASRSIQAKEAYDRVFEATNKLKTADTKVFAKRIDSTLRGNLGAETDAMLDALGDKYIALIAPSFPSSGRIISGGYVLVNSVPLHKTVAAIDPKTPVKTSCLADLYKAQSKYEVASIDIGEMQKGKANVIGLIKKYVSDGIRNICFDAVTDDDLDFIAECGVEAGFPFINVSPGPFTASVAKKLIKPKEENDKSILIVIGSVNPVTNTQVAEVMPSKDIFSVPMYADELLKDDIARKNEIDKVVKAILDKKDEYKIFAILVNGMDLNRKIDLVSYVKEHGGDIEVLSARINTAFAEATSSILDSNKNIKAAYVSGGDITVALCEKLNVVSVSLLDEVLPLAAYAKLGGGKYDGFKIITKGGMAGDKFALKNCINYLKTHI